MPRYYEPGVYIVNVVEQDFVKNTKGNLQFLLRCAILGKKNPETQEVESCNPGNCNIYNDLQMNNGDWMLDYFYAKINKAFGCNITDPDEIHPSNEKHLSFAGANVEVELSHYDKNDGGKGESWQLPRPARQGGSVDTVSRDDLKKIMAMHGKSKPKSGTKTKGKNGEEIPF